MNWHPSIPKIMHCYWGKNASLSYLRYLTVLTFSRLNPDWRIFVYYPEKPIKDTPWDSPEHDIRYKGECYFYDLGDIDNVSLRMVKFENDIPSEVQRSDYLRWQLLCESGGLWSDMDILYLKPMTDLDLPNDIDSVVCSNEGKKGFYYIIGFLLSTKDSGFFKAIHDKTNELLEKGDCDWRDYQFFGNRLVKRVHKKIPDTTFSLPTQVIYPALSSNNNIVAGETIIFSNTIGVHWYAGLKNSVINFERAISPNSQRFNRSFIMREVARIIK